MANHEFIAAQITPMYPVMDFPTYALARRWIDAQPADRQSELMLMLRGNGRIIWRADWTLVDNARAMSTLAEAYGYRPTADDESMLSNPHDGTDADGHYVDANYTLHAILRESEEWLSLECLFCSEIIYPTGTGRGFRTVGDSEAGDAEPYVCPSGYARNEGWHVPICRACAGRGCDTCDGSGCNGIVGTDTEYWEGTE